TESIGSGSYQIAPSSGSFTVHVQDGAAAGPYQFINALYNSISGRKLRDITGNGISADDTGLGGVTIYIDSNANGSPDSGEPSTVTAAGTGSYSFTNLVAGTYVIREIAPGGTYQTGPASGSYTIAVFNGQN